MKVFQLRCQFEVNLNMSSTCLYTILYIILLIINNVNSSSCQVITDTLCVNQINEDGFGDLHNQYAFSMEVFKGSLYVGTLNANNAADIQLFVFGLPFATNGTQVTHYPLHHFLCHLYF